MPHNEAERIAALQQYSILDTPRDGNFDHITALTALLFDVPIAIISLVDTDRIWFKSAFGLSIHQVDRAPGLCASAILADDVYVINDAGNDPRALANPLVAGDFGLKFYAAVPLQTADHLNLGTLCIIDKVPRSISDKERQVLKLLGNIVMGEMDARLSLRNTVTTLKKIASDIGYQLDDSIAGIKKEIAGDSGSRILDYLEASKSYLKNVEDQMDFK